MHINIPVNLFKIIEPFFIKNSSFHLFKYAWVECLFKLIITSEKEADLGIKFKT